MQVLITITLGVSLLQQAICYGELAHLLVLLPLASREPFRLISADKKCQIFQASQNSQEPEGLPPQPAGMISLSFRHVVPVRQKPRCMCAALCCSSDAAGPASLKKSLSSTQILCVSCSCCSLCSLVKRIHFLNIMPLLFRLFPLFLMSFFFFFRKEFSHFCHCSSL